MRGGVIVVLAFFALDLSTGAGFLSMIVNPYRHDTFNGIGFLVLLPLYITGFFAQMLVGTLGLSHSLFENLVLALCALVTAFGVGAFLGVFYGMLKRRRNEKQSFSENTSQNARITTGASSPRRFSVLYIFLFLVFAVLLSAMYFPFMTTGPETRPASSPYEQEVTIQGTMTKVDVSPTFVDGVPIFEMQTDDGRRVRIRTFSSESAQLCPGKELGLGLEFGSKVEIHGTLFDHGRLGGYEIDYCSSAEGYLKVISQ